MKKTKELSDIEVDEVSIVGKPANKRPFIFFKGEHTMEKELIELLKKLSGDENYTFKKQELSEDAVKALKEAVATVEKYKEEMPDDLLKAGAVLAEFAASGYGETKEEDKKDDKDATKTDPEKKDNQDADKKKDDDVNKASDEIVKSITALKEEITKYGSSITKVTEDVTALATRMEVVEKTTGIKKGIESQGDDKDGNDLFPGLKI